MPPKKVTTLKHTRDRNDEDCPSYANMTEIAKTVGLTEENRKEIHNLITRWVDENKPPTLTLRSESEKLKVKPLITIIDTAYKDVFEDLEPTFIKSTIMALIQRSFYNLRRSSRQLTADDVPTDHSQTSPPQLQSSHTTPSPQLKPSPVAPTSRVPAMSETPQPHETMAIVGEVEDYGIRGCIVTNADNNMVLTGSRTSHSSIGDVLQQPTSTARSLLQQLSFDIWTGILISDLSYTPAYTITYNFEDERCAIRSDRVFRAAVIDSRRRGRPWALFEITPPGMSRHLVEPH